MQGNAGYQRICELSRFLFDLITFIYDGSPVFLILYIMKNKTGSICQTCWYSFAELELFLRRTLALSWLDCGGGGGLSLLLSLPSSVPFSSVSWGGGEKGQRRLASAGRGKSDRKQEVERQTMEWRRAWKDGESKRDRGREGEAKNKPWSASQSRSHRGEEALRGYVCVCLCVCVCVFKGKNSGDGRPT